MKISLKKRLNKGKYSWYIHYYLGSTVNNNGGKKHIQEWETLGIYTLVNPITKEEIANNMLLQTKAEEIFKRKELDFLNKKNNISPTKQEKIFTNSSEQIDYAINILLNNTSKIPADQLEKFLILINKRHFQKINKKVESIFSKLSERISALEKLELQNKAENEIDNKYFFGSKEACKYLSISYSTLTKLTKDKKIPFYKPTNRNMYFFKEELDKWIISNNNE